MVLNDDVKMLSLGGRLCRTVDTGLEAPIEDTETSAVADFAELAVPSFELRPRKG